MKKGKIFYSIIILLVFNSCSNQGELALDMFYKKISEVGLKKFDDFEYSSRGNFWSYSKIDTNFHCSIQVKDSEKRLIIYQLKNFNKYFQVLSDTSRISNKDTYIYILHDKVSKLYLLKDGIEVESNKDVELVRFKEVFNEFYELERYKNKYKIKMINQTYGKYIEFSFSNGNVLTYIYDNNPLIIKGLEKNRYEVKFLDKHWVKSNR